MKPPRFEYLTARCVEEALQALANLGPEARPLAGGQSLVPLMNFRLARPAYLIDLSGISELAFIRPYNGSLAIGAMTRQSVVEDSALVAAECPLLAEAVRFIGHRTIRNRGTIGGSLAHADPAAELPAVVAALAGDVVVRSSAGERVIHAADFFLTAFTTSMAPDELLCEIRFPLLPGRTGWSFVELSRRHGDYAVVGVAAIVTLDGGEICSDVRLAVAGVGQIPIRCLQAEDLLKWSVPDRALIESAARCCAELADPQDDSYAPASYKRGMVAVLVERAVRQATTRARRFRDASRH